MKRRHLLLGAGGLALGLIAPGIAAPREPTPSQTEGPFYPVTITESDADLTRVSGHKGKARGVEVVITGTVRNLDGEPLAGATVELWQACASGRYNHPRDPNDAPPDPAFQYYGSVVTDRSGAYRFRTIKPGAYPAGRNWFRPPHIHFKVRQPGYSQLVTQMYFEGEQLNREDFILNALSKAQRKLVIVQFSPVKKTLTGAFDITLGHEGRYSKIVTPFLD